MRHRRPLTYAELAGKPRQARAITRRILDGQGAHTVHLQLGVRDPGCRLCPPPDGGTPTLEPMTPGE